MPIPSACTKAFDDTQSNRGSDIQKAPRQSQISISPIAYSKPKQIKPTTCRIKITNNIQILRNKAKRPTPEETKT